MKDRKFHINRKLNDDYPSPDVPADDAWAAMNAMLDADVQKPVAPLDDHKNPGGNNILKLAVLLIAIASVVMLVRHKKQVVNGLNEEITYTADNKKDAGVLKMHDKQNGNKAIGNTNKNNTPAGRTVTPLTPKATVLSEGVNKNDGNLNEQQNISLHDEATSQSLKNNNNNIADNANITERDTRNNIPVNSNNGNHRNRIGASHYKENNIAETDMLVHNGQQNNSFNNITPSSKPGYVSGIEIMDKLAWPLDASLASFIIPRGAAISLDEKLTDTLYAIATTKRNRGSVHGKSKNAVANILSGFNYGVQWEVPFPLQGTDFYFKGTNGVSKPYNTLIPQLWVSKGLSKKSSLVLMLNFNQQYFIDNRELSEVTAFVMPSATNTSKKTLYKTGGFGGTISYSYKIYKRWSGTGGINYTLNRTALIDKQGINTYTGTKISDSLYRIDRYSFDWRYINKSMLSARLELSYDLKHFNFGASANIPLSAMPVSKNIKIHPVNAQLFIRWNLKGL